MFWQTFMVIHPVNVGTFLSDLLLEREGKSDNGQISLQSSWAASLEPHCACMAKNEKETVHGRANYVCFYIDCIIHRISLQTFQCCPADCWSAGITTNVTTNTPPEASNIYSNYYYYYYFSADWTVELNRAASAAAWEWGWGWWGPSNSR